MRAKRFDSASSRGGGPRPGRALIGFLVFLLVASASSAQGMKGNDSAAAPPGGSMMAAVPSSSVFDLRGMAPGVMPFSSEAAAQALAARRRVLYFFASVYCAGCRDAYRSLKAGIKQLPPDMSVLVVDFDAAGPLEAKYGVTAPHSFVLIGAGGEALKAWRGTSTVDEISRNAAKP